MQCVVVCVLGGDDLLKLARVASGTGKTRKCEVRDLPTSAGVSSDEEDEDGDGQWHSVEK